MGMSALFIMTFPFVGSKNFETCGKKMSLNFLRNLREGATVSKVIFNHFKERVIACNFQLDSNSRMSDFF